jgi:hypothetical protein
MIDDGRLRAEGTPSGRGTEWRIAVTELERLSEASPS